LIQKVIEAPWKVIRKLGHSAVTLIADRCQRSIRRGNDRLSLPVESVLKSSLEFTNLMAGALDSRLDVFLRDVNRAAVFGADLVESGVPEAIRGKLARNGAAHSPNESADARSY
jgi:hypothetical protein